MKDIIKKYEEQFEKWAKRYWKQELRGDRRCHFLGDEYRLDPAKACRRALAMSRNIPWRDRLEVIDALLDTNGTEGITGDFQNGYWCNIVAAYCNTGETYDLTVMHVRGATRWDEQGKLIVCSWGDWVEKNGNKFGVQ